jgi:glycosyltransferase involved in cell wall biosynthesis
VIDVLIPSHNGARTIEPVLLALRANLAGKTPFRVTVVPNGCSDDTAARARAFADRLPLEVIERAEGGKNRALNHAIGRSSAPLVVTMDDDALVGPTYFDDLAALAAEHEGIDFFGGPVRPRFAAPPSPLQSAFFDEEIRGTLFAELELPAPEGEVDPWQLYGPALAIRRRILGSDRPFAENVGPDGSARYAMGSETEFLDRHGRGGARAYYHFHLGVEHLIEPEATTWRFIFARAGRYGRGRMRRQIAADPALAESPLPLFHWRRAAVHGLAAAAQALRLDRAAALRRLWHARGQLGAASEYLKARRERRT